MTIAIEKNPVPIFPGNLLSEAYIGKTWFVCHVKSRREKALANYLYRSRISYFLPLVKHRQASGNRIRYSLIPVFPGYVFVNCSLDARHDILKTNHVSRLIDVNDTDTLIWELRQIQSVLSTDKPIFPVELLDVGQRVRVKKGPMKGIEGIVQRKDKKFRIHLTVTSIMQSIAIELDADMVEVI